VKSCRLRILALLGALAILLGLMVSAVAVPCSDGAGAPMSCDVCLVGVLPGGPVCTSTSQAVPASSPVAGRSAPAETQAWFADPVIHPYRFHPSPDFPPPR
jgi:hypothetical protein